MGSVTSSTPEYDGYECGEMPTIRSTGLDSVNSVEDKRCMRTLKNASITFK